MTETSAKVSEIMSGCCGNTVPIRLTAEDETRPNGFAFELGCMFCELKAQGDTPREAVDNWNDKVEASIAARA